MTQPVRIVCTVALFMLVCATRALALPSVVVYAPKAMLTLELARTDTQRAHGLMNREVLAAHHGMLFVFAADGARNFWMKRTLVPLDMVFVGGDGRINAVAENVPVVSKGAPDRAIPRRSGHGRYVIELPAHEARADGLTAGRRISLPQM